jgi:hypothetical protein
LQHNLNRNSSSTVKFDSEGGRPERERKGRRESSKEREKRAKRASFLCGSQGERHFKIKLLRK